MAFDGKIQDYTPPVVDEVGAIILKARELLSDPAKWMKGDYHNKERTAFCTVGAVQHVYGNATGSLLGAILARLDSVSPPKKDPFHHLRAIAQFNDDPATTHADVLALLDRAARPTREGEGQ